MPRITPTPLRAAREHWRDVVAELEERLAKARAFLNVLEDPELGEEAAKSFAVDNGKARQKVVPKRSSGQKEPIAFDKLRDWLIDNGNPWISANNLAAKAGIRQERARHVLYISHPTKFEKRRQPGTSRRTQFRLKQANKAEDTE